MYHSPPVRQPKSLSREGMSYKECKEVNVEEDLNEQQVDKQVFTGEVHGPHNRADKTTMTSVTGVQYHRDLFRKVIVHEKSPKRDTKGDDPTLYGHVHGMTHVLGFKDHGTPLGEMLLTHELQKRENGQKNQSREFKTLKADYNPNMNPAENNKNKTFFEKSMKAVEIDDGGRGTRKRDHKTSYGDDEEAHTTENETPIAGEGQYSHSVQGT